MTKIVYIAYYNCKYPSVHAFIVIFQQNKKHYIYNTVLFVLKNDL